MLRPPRCPPIFSTSTGLLHIYSGPNLEKHVHGSRSVLSSLPVARRAAGLSRPFREEVSERGSPASRLDRDLLPIVIVELFWLELFTSMSLLNFALVVCRQRRVPDLSKPYFHFGGTVSHTVSFSRRTYEFPIRLEPRLVESGGLPGLRTSILFGCRSFLGTHENILMNFLIGIGAGGRLYEPHELILRAVRDKDFLLHDFPDLFLIRPWNFFLSCLNNGPHEQGLPEYAT